MSERNELAVIEKNNALAVSNEIPVMDKLLVAVQNGMTIETLEKFMDLAERNQKREAENAFHKAFAEFKANPPKIVKDKAVSYGTTKYKHATIGKVVDAIIEGMSKHGLSHSWCFVQSGSNITVTCTITHFMGHSQSASITAGADNSGGKNPIQGIASTITYLERYTLQAVTGIAVLEHDDDGRGHKPPVIDAAYWCDKLDGESEKTEHGIKSWKAKNIKAINKMEEGREKTHVLNYLDDMLKEYTPAKTDKKQEDRTFVDKALNYLKSDEISCSLDSFLNAWTAYIVTNIKKLPASQQKELMATKEEIEKKFQG